MKHIKQWQESPTFDISCNMYAKKISVFNSRYSVTKNTLAFMKYAWISPHRLMCFLCKCLFAFCVCSTFNTIHVCTPRISLVLTHLFISICITVTLVRLFLETAAVAVLSLLLQTSHSVTREWNFNIPRWSGRASHRGAGSHVTDMSHAHMCMSLYCVTSLSITASKKCSRTDFVEGWLFD